MPLPAHLELAALIRRAQAEGGFAAVLRKGEPDAGTILVVGLENGSKPVLYERMPALKGGRRWTLSRAQDAEKKSEFEDYLKRRSAQDPDAWLVELDVANVERFISSLTEAD